MSDIAYELHRMVLGIVEDLEAAASGTLYKVDGNYVVIDDLDEWKKEQYEKEAEKFRREHPESSFTVPQTPGVGDAPSDSFDSYQEWMEDEIGVADDVDEPDEVSLSEYMEKQALGDVRFEVDSSKELHGGKVLFTFGGPNIWVADDEVRGYWGKSRVEMPLDSETQSALFSWFEEQWNMVGG